METLSGGQRQGIAVARAAAFGSRVIIMDEPTAALGVKEARRVLELILDVKRKGLPIVLISHNMPHVFELADRIHIHRLGRRICRRRPQDLLHARSRRHHDRGPGAAGLGRVLLELSFRHSRESGNPGPQVPSLALDSRFRGNDGGEEEGARVG